MPAVDSEGFAWYALPDGEPNWRYLTASEIAERAAALGRLPRPRLFMDGWHYGPIEPTA